MKKWMFALPLAMALVACGGSGDDAATKLGEKGDKIEAVKAPEGKNWAETVTEGRNGSFILGNPDAPIKLEEYASFTCVHCADFSVNGFPDLRDNFIATGRVNLELHHFNSDPIGLTVSALVQCAPDQSYFALSEQAFVNYDAMMAKYKEIGQETFSSYMNAPPQQRLTNIAIALGLLDFFAQRGLAKDQARQCLSDMDNIQKIAEMTQKDNEEREITGTPTFYVNGQRADFTGWPALKTQIEEMGAR